MPRYVTEDIHSLVESDLTFSGPLVLGDYSLATSKDDKGGVVSN